MEEFAAYIQTGLGSIAALVGMGLAVWVVRTPNMIGAVLVGVIFLTGIAVAVPAARPWIVRVIERVPGMKDLPDDEGTP